MCSFVEGVRRVQGLGSVSTVLQALGWCAYECDSGWWAGVF